MYDKISEKVAGLNLMGIRYRHEVCEKWLRQSAHIEEVLQNLGMANFDPEFFDQYEQRVAAVYNQQTGKIIQIRLKRGLSAVLNFLNK